MIFSAWVIHDFVNWSNQKEMLRIKTCRFLELGLEFRNIEMIYCSYIEI